MAEEAIGHSPVELGVYPKAQVLDRFIAKTIDLLIVAAASKLVPPIGVLAGLAYILLADGFGGGRSVGKRLIGLQTIVPRTRDPAGFRESIIRNPPCGLAQLAFEIPYGVGLAGARCCRWKGCWSLGMSRGVDWVMTSPRRRYWRADSWMCRIERVDTAERRNRAKESSRGLHE